MILLVLLAILMRVLVPAGFMPEFDNGKVALTICHGAETTTIFVDADQAPGKTKTPVCPFTPVSAQAATLDAPALLATLPVSYQTLAYRDAQQAALFNTARQSAQPRAPPVTL